MASPDAGADSERLDQAARRELAELFEITLLHRRGPASIVYLARDRECDGRLVALKVMPRAPGAGAGLEAQQEFHRAAAAAAVVDDPHAALMYSAGTTDACFWYTSAYVDGPSLAELLRNGAMELPACLRLIRQVASGLDAAHQRHLIHADLKPTNVVIDASGSARVTDFWVPHVLEQLGALGPGVTVRRPEYVAPEDRSAGGAPSPEGDQYGLAMLVGECLGGRVSTSGVTFPGAGMPARIASALARALAPLPEDRFANVGDFVAALHAPAPSVASLPSPLPRVPTPQAPTSRPVSQAPAGDPESVPPIILDPAEFEEEQPGRWRRRVRVALVALVAIAAVGAAWMAASAWLSRPMPAWSGAPVTPPDTGPSLDSLVARLAPAPSRSSSSLDTVNQLSHSSTLAPSLGHSSRLAADSSAPSVDPAPKPRPARPPVKRAPPPLPGRLFVNSTPWGSVYLDGIPIGNTPRVGVSVTPGVHQVRVERDGYVPFERSVTVAADRDVRLTDIVLREMRP